MNLARQPSMPQLLPQPAQAGSQLSSEHSHIIVGNQQRLTDQECMLRVIAHHAPAKRQPHPP